MELFLAHHQMDSHHCHHVELMGAHNKTQQGIITIQLKGEHKATNRRLLHNWRENTKQLTGDCYATEGNPIQMNGKHTPANELDSNWTLTSCQPHRVTSGQSHSSHRQMHISKLFSYITFYKPFVKSTQKNIPSQTWGKSIHAQTVDTNFQNVSSFNITPVKRTHKARTCWYRRPFRLIYRYHIK